MSKPLDELAQVHRGIHPLGRRAEDAVPPRTLITARVRASSTKSQDIREFAHPKCADPTLNMAPCVCASAAIMARRSACTSHKPCKPDARRMPAKCVWWNTFGQEQDGAGHLSHCIPRAARLDAISASRRTRPASTGFPSGLRRTGRHHTRSTRPRRLCP